MIRTDPTTAGSRRAPANPGTRGRAWHLLLVCAAGLCLAACGAFGDLDTAAMQTTNRAAGAPTNGPGNPPPPPKQSNL